MMRSIVTAVAVAIMWTSCTCWAGVEEFHFREGEPILGTQVMLSGGVVLIKLVDGSMKKVEEDTIESRIPQPDLDPPPAPPPPPDPLADLKRMGEEERQRRLDATHEQLGNARAEMREGERYDDRRVETLKEKIAMLEAQKNQYLPTLSPEVGSVGVFREATRYTTPGFVIVNQITGPHDMVIEAYGQTIWLAEFPTENLIDGQRISLERLFWIVGTKTYTTVLGAPRTILRAEPFTPEEAKQPEEESEGSEGKKVP